MKTKIMKKYFTRMFLISLLAFFYKSCMEPPDYDQGSNLIESFDIEDNIMDPNSNDLNLNFEDGLDHWRFNSKKARLTDPNHSIQMNIDENQFSSGEKSLRLELINEKFTASRYFSLQSGDSLFTTIDVFLDLDSNYVFSSGNPYRLNLRIFYYNEDGGLITSNGSTTTALSKDKWVTLPLNGSIINPFLDYVRFDVEIFGFDSIPIFIDNLNLIYKSNNVLQDAEFSLDLPSSDTNSNINDTTFFSWSNINNEDTTTVYSHKMSILLQEQNLILNGSFETSANSLCNGEPNFPSQWWMFPYCWDFDQWSLDLNTGYDPFSAFISSDIKKSGNTSLSLKGLYSDSLQNFNTIWQWISSDGLFDSPLYARVVPGSKLTFEGYIYTPDTNRISGSNTVELGIFAFNERDENMPAISPVFDKTYTPNQWHKFSVTATIPQWKNTGKSQCGIYIRYNQYNNSDGVVYIDDLTLVSDKPYNYTVTIFETNENQSILTPNRKSSIRSFWRNWSVNWRNDASGIKQPHNDIDTLKLMWEVTATTPHNQASSINGPFYLNISE